MIEGSNNLGTKLISRASTLALRLVLSPASKRPSPLAEVWQVRNLDNQVAAQPRRPLTDNEPGKNASAAMSEPVALNATDARG
jgi:hypothetical protein